MEHGFPSRRVQLKHHTLTRGTAEERGPIEVALWVAHNARFGVAPVGPAREAVQDRLLAGCVGAAGSYVLLKGTNLLGPGTVLFSGAPRQFASRGGHYGLAQVPAEATSGPISIATPNGIATSHRAFLVK